MKKNLLLFIALFLVVTVGFSQSPVLVCTPDPTYVASGKKGIWPDSATNFNPGTANLPYLQDVTVVVPYDTTVSPFGQLIYQKIEVTAITGLPAGIVANPAPTIIFPGNSTNCMTLSGTPTVAGTYTLNMTVSAYLQGLFIPITQNITYYKIIIAPNTTGILSKGSAKFELSQNSPNPAEGKSVIKFNVPTDGKSKLKVFNTLGKIVHEENLQAVKGENTFEINGKDFAEGMYIYSVEFNGKSLTKKMVISSN